MKKRDPAMPGFFVDALPGISGTDCRELFRRIEIRAGAPDIYVWLKQLRVAPYSFDFLDNRGMKSPGYIIENLPPLKVNAHFLLAFHITGFEEDRFIAGRFCVPINPPVNRYMKDMFIEYRIQQSGLKTWLWCKVRGWFNRDIPSKGFFMVFSLINKIMTEKQLRRIKKLSEKLAAGGIESGPCDLKKYHLESGVLWWAFCRRINCKGLTA